VAKGGGNCYQYDSYGDAAGWLPSIITAPKRQNRIPEMIRTEPPFATPKIVSKPWGREIWYAHEERYAGKVLEVTVGHALSLQKHERKMETLYLQSGRILFHFNGADFEMHPGQCITVRPGDVHRMEALEDSVFLEVSTPELDDVVRLEDRYGREVASGT
jgi:mannose-6-phosphate isomerase